MSLKATTRDRVEQVARVDAAIDRAVAPYAEEPLVRALALASDIGDQPQLRTISGACIAAGLVTGNRRLARAGFRMLLTHEVATLFKNIVKDQVDRTRPRTAESMRDRQLRRGRSSAKEESSFPSGHTAGALAVARAFSREFPEYRTAALGAAGVVAAAQVPRCAHYVSDVGAGAVIGLLAEVAGDRIWRALGALER